MEPDQESLWRLFGPLIAAYLAACGGWLLVRGLRPGWWPQRPPLRTDHKWRDLAMVLVATVLVLGLGQVWRAGWLLPEPDGWWGDVVWQVNNLIIYAPVFLVLAHRGQSPETVYLSVNGLPVKLAAGLLLGLLGVVVFLALRGELGRLPGVALSAVRGENLRNFLPVFLEGVVLAFAYVRLRWAVGQWPALIAPGLLFAAAHIPRQLESGLGVPEMAAYFAVTAGVAGAVLYTLERSRDVVWLGIVHYLMDVAIGAF
ncbi:MAG: CPBP family glutamic-type intramembrane protease [Planctomycetota bacterium]|jgi:hypothetical protein